MIKIHNILDILEVDGIKPEQDTRMQIISHDTYESCIIIQIGDKAITVIASDLKSAIENATNNNRFS
jgi:hypothetical protein